MTATVRYLCLFLPLRDILFYVFSNKNWGALLDHWNCQIYFTCPAQLR